QHIVRQGVERDIEPLSATVGVPPALQMHPLGIVAKEEVFAPDHIACGGVRPGEVSGAAADELALVAQAAPRAVELHHGFAAPASISARSLRQRLRRSGARW